jgi:DoxX-like family
VQLCAVLGYIFALTILSPILWFDLFGALIKNVPIIALIFVERILSEER